MSICSTNTTAASAAHRATRLAMLGTRLRIESAGRASIDAPTFGAGAGDSGPTGWAAPALTGEAGIATEWGLSGAATAGFEPPPTDDAAGAGDAGSSTGVEGATGAV